MSGITSTEKKRRFIMFCLLGLLVAGGIVFASFALFGPEKPASTAKLTKVKTESVKGQAGGEGSDEYNKKLETHDAQKADTALKAGDSFIPTPVGKKAPIVQQKTPTPPPPPAVAQVRTAPVQAPRTDNSMLKRMMEDLAALDTKLSSVSAGEGKIVWLHDFSKDERQAVAPVSKTISPDAEISAPANVAVQPGDLLYAVIDTGVNSDVPSAVMATIASGKLKNARLLGKFQRFEERLVLAFSSINLPSGERLQVEAYAVDPSTSEASVASSVDTHFFSRWGGLIASAFLEGLGTAKRYSGAQSTVYGNVNETTDQMIWSTYSPADQAWIAAGKVGERAGKIFEKNFERPPTVYLEQGTPVGILVLNVKDAK
jgi:type IV secretory pathway VirB10-like protein